MCPLTVHRHLAVQGGDEEPFVGGDSIGVRPVHGRRVAIQPGTEFGFNISVLHALVAEPRLDDLEREQKPLRQVRTRWRQPGGVGGSSGTTKHLVALSQEVGVGPQRFPPRNLNPLSRQPLQTVDQHRPVDLVEDIAPHLHHVVGAHAQDVAVEGGVVQLAERQSVRDDRLPERVRVGQDVRGVQEFAVTQTAHGARLPVGGQDTLPEADLVQALLNQPGDVTAPRIVLQRRGCTSSR